LQESIRKVVRALPGTPVKDRGEFEQLLDAASKKAGAKLPAPARKAILFALSERDETAAICASTSSKQRTACPSWCARRAPARTS
jgi:type I restriction enzyme M protein